MKYKWTRTPTGGYSAQVVGEELELIQQKAGSLTPEIVLRAATPKRSKLHDCFEWDNAVAAHEHRLSQARYLLRSIEVVYEEQTGQKETRSVEIRAFHNVEDEDGESVYVTVNQARQNAEYWNQVKERALSEIKSWQAKYQSIKEFEVIFNAIGQVA
jgi:hypothetical protein